MIRSALWLLVALSFCAAGCTSKPDVTRLKATDVTEIQIMGSDVASATRIGPPEGGFGEVTISDPTTIARFVEAFSHKTKPKDIATDKVNHVVFSLRDGTTVSFEFGRNTLLFEDGPEVATVIRPYLTKD